MKNAFIIKDTTVLKACLDFAKALGLTIDPSNYDRNINEGISVGTSKNFVVAGNSDANFYTRKKGLELIPLDADEDNVVDFISTVLSHYDDTDPATEVDQYEVATEEDESGFNHEAINLLYAKVKKMKKSPSNYYVVDNDGEYQLTKDSSEDNLGNLAEIFSSIN